MERKVVETMKVPSSFLKRKEEMKTLNLKIVNVIGMKKGEEMIKDIKKVNEIENVEERKATKEYEIEKIMAFLLNNADDKKKKKINMLIKLLGYLQKILWIEFRAENLDNSFGEAEHLFYNEEKKQIEIIIEY